MYALQNFSHYLDHSIREFRCFLCFKSFQRYRKLRAHFAAAPVFSVPEQSNSAVVLFDFFSKRIDGPQGRRFYALYTFFQRAGFQPFVVDRYSFLSNLHHKHKAFVQQQALQVLRGQAPAQPFVLVSDAPKRSSYFNAAQKAVRVSFDSDFNEASTDFPMPFPMFSGVYRSAQDLQLKHLRQTRRQWSVFFGGGAQEGKYSKAAIEKIYSVMPRAKALAVLKSAFGPQWRQTSEQQTLGEHLNSDWPGIQVIENSQCKIGADQWLASLAKARFFLALPGVRYPMSHNLIESLALGVVPILQYNRLLFPALEHGKNCLVYSDDTSLKQVVADAMAMPETRWRQMSAAAIDYYQSYLAPEAAIRSLLQHPADGKLITMRLLPFLKRGGGYA
ncbi:glycosyltransferase [Agaribacterium haliotis]|uniref:glycosyltransferase n=1 Tax=Agaribacterium haliotis TaxID=2013869 RepID=UPI000BB5855A|nr:hypothetical protein [Agaribacterium haliotis]